MNNTIINKCPCCNREVEIQDNIKEEPPVFIGKTNILLSYEGEYPANPGTDVFEYKDSYLVYFKTVKGETISRKYRIETLQPFIEFL